MARNFERPILILNMGGVANITWIGEGGAFIAFDAGPANALIDDWIQAHTNQSYDEGGRFAQQGTINFAALESLLAHQYFELPPPKSLDEKLNGDPVSVDGLYTETLGLKSSVSVALKPELSIGISLENLS